MTNGGSVVIVKSSLSRMEVAWDGEEWVSREPADVFSNADVKGARGRERGGNVVFESHE